ncbi:FAD-dependent oxidoreductase [Cyanobium sp. Morenito 9A2]|uniref:FAD-dependent oxidoreductase n=1 Tax=Cyanobium sp. Morenito 9A2 TaxID=2823718 RepID=UPI0020CCA11E|nr:FAD-dependent oxidoreductase [Cyanobium sp. Morenito 9A2]MCP9850396.1 FAD-dependent oxidoreductase [Cyanobium sp. Morenito 9A2]
MELIEAEVIGIETAGRRMQLQGTAGPSELGYDRLVLALGSVLARPDLRGLETHGFDVDTYAGAVRLDQHLRYPVLQPASPGQFTVVGGGPASPAWSWPVNCRGGCGICWRRRGAASPCGWSWRITSPGWGQAWASMPCR